MLMDIIFMINKKSRLTLAAALCLPLAANAATDSSGKITIEVFEGASGSIQSVTRDLTIAVPDGYLAIGGGAMGTNAGQGNYVTASYPSDDLSSWVVSSSDHLWAHPIELKGYAIGIKVEGLTSQELLSYIDVQTEPSSNLQKPTTKVSVLDGYVQIGGGAQIVMQGAGNLLTSSYPTDTGLEWEVRSTDHLVASATVHTAYSIGILKNIPGVGEIEVDTRSTTSVPTQHPIAGISPPNGYALTSCGAEVDAHPLAGNHIFQIIPYASATSSGCTVGSKDQGIVDSTTIKVYSTGIRVK